jgi:hypothetical protein
MKPSEDIERILYSGSIDTTQLDDDLNDLYFLNYGDFKEINWLNTPGPIYTTYTDNCGTGQVEAMNNVGGDEDYHEVIFKQPFTKQELKETLSAAAIDPFGAYYFDGNLNWTKELITEWWLKSSSRINFVVALYNDELKLPDILDRPLYGPREPIPENYKNWLDFYQNGMKEYLEWYIFKLSGRKSTLDNLSFDWTLKSKLDTLLASKKNSR